MATLTIRNVDEHVKRKLKIRAAYNGRSMEAEIRVLLENVDENIEEINSKRLTAMQAQLRDSLGPSLERLFYPLKRS